jgi:hypothetical protein
MGKNPDNERYSEEESQRRFEALVRAAVNTPPKPLKGAGKTKARKSNDKPRSG